MLWLLIPICEKEFIPLLSWRARSPSLCRRPVNSLTRLAAVKFPSNADLTLQEDYCILVKINLLALLYTGSLVQLLKLLNVDLQGFYLTRDLRLNLAGGPKIIDWPPVWSAQLCLRMEGECMAEVAPIHRLFQETSAWLTSSCASPKGVLSIRALLTSYTGRYSCEAAIPQEQKYCQSSFILELVLTTRCQCLSLCFIPLLFWCVVV